MLSAVLLAVKLACAKLGSTHLLWQSGPSEGGPKLSCCWGCLQTIFCRIRESSRGHICFCHGPDPAGFRHAQLLSETMSMQGCKIGPVTTISWQREKTNYF